MALKSVRLRQCYILREYAGEFCVFDAARTDDGAVNDIPSFNQNGIFLWSLLERGIEDIEQLNALLAGQNDEDPDETMPDVHEFLARLINADIAEGA